MGKFVLGFVFAVIVLCGGALACLMLGWLDTNADAPVGNLERQIASRTIDASVDRHADRTNNPVPENAATLKDGMTIYVMNCATCHGGLDKKPSPLGKNLYPHAPQLIVRPLDDPEWRTFYVVKHGISRTGMPAWDKILSEQDLWKVTAFVSNLEKLPPEVQSLMPAPAAAGTH